ncbi:4Fe-4S binding domain-containing protein [Halogranum amylolyticum]|uniref:4Fe-4S binding domain-containing protein n=1 Tax=Halogranum amylolyticum TaxID=660520 RepID=A0A1H8VF76_9EURY|nr:hydrogenase iron-sulfur subunit [Halogranum amylolyticum]SEP13857.1 4Fe-4S binding domain-containing protein [Halogranum amylolyticum]
MNTGAFVCACGGTCDLDLEKVRDGVRDVEVVASSRLLCQDGLGSMARVIDEYDIDQLLVTATAESCKERIRSLATAHGLHPDATVFVDHREGAAWVHDEAEATDKVARLLNATRAGLAEEAVSRTVSREAGKQIAVIDDAETAIALAETADVTLVANGSDFSGVEGLSDVTLERGRVEDIEGSYGAFEISLAARVTDDCIDCMNCVHEAPDEHVTARPVDVAPSAPDGEWVDVCPTDAIALDGVRRTIEADQIVYPEADPVARGGHLGYYTGPTDGATIAAIESLLGGVEKPDFLDLEMDVCAAGDSSQRGCIACTDACPHGAIDRPAVDRVEFDKIACQNCGACTSVCPTGATMLREPSNERLAREVEALLATDESGGLLSWRGTAGIETEVVAFVCSERARERLHDYGKRAARNDDVSYPPILPVSVNCTDTVGEPHVMHALAAGADGVVVVGCGDDCIHSGPDPKATLVEHCNQAAIDLGLGERVAFLAPGSDATSFTTDLRQFVDELDTSPVPAGEHVATGRIGERTAESAGDTDPMQADGGRPYPDFDGHGWTLESVRVIVEHTDPERDLIRGLSAFGRMTVSDACNFTPTCSNLCPTDAIRRTEDGDLEFNHERCVNCGLCEEGCPETAITIQGGLDLSLLPERRDGDPWVTVYEGELLECVRCGKPFTSVASAEKIQDEVGDLVAGIAPDSEHSIFEYCGDCRTRLLFGGDAGQ